ncbi:universal stress protein [Jatrophihabitans fulvus]
MAPERILVGLDGSAASWQALEWAAHHARRTARHLLAVHVARDEAAAAAATEVRHRASAMLDRLGVEGRADVVVGDPSRVMSEVAATATSSVLGRSRRRTAPARIGSVTHTLMSRSSVPVIVVPGRDDRRPRTTDGPVVLAASPTRGGLAAMRFACAEAGRAGVELVALRAWSDQSVTFGYVGGLPLLPMDSETGELAALSVVVGTAAEEFPDVRVTERFVDTPVETALRRAGRRASLVVLGCRRESTHWLSRTGPLTSWATRHLPCPVAAVPVPVPAAPEPV